MAIFLRGTIYHYEFTVRGQRYRGSTEETKPARARTVESQKRAEALNRNAPPTSRKAPTLAEAAKLFLAEIKDAAAAGNLAANTLRHYRNAWDAWLSESAVAHVRVDRITAAHIAALKFPGGPFTAKNARQALGHILNWCAQEEQGYITACPKIRSTRTTGRKLRYTDEMKDAMLAHMDRDCADIFTIMLDALMRPEEVMRIRWANVEWDQKRIFIPTGKTAAARRYVPMSERMIALLEARKENGSEWVFPSRPLIDAARRKQALAMFAAGSSVQAVAKALGTAWKTARRIRDGEINASGKDRHRTTVAKRFRETRVECAVSNDYKLYAARHTGASELSELGVDLLTMRTILGHEDISTTNKYLHGDIKGVADVVNKRNKRGPVLVEKRA